MSATTARSTPEAFHEFVATVDRFTSEASRIRSDVAGLLYAGLLLAAQGPEEITDSAGSEIAGP